MIIVEIKRDKWSLPDVGEVAGKEGRGEFDPWVPIYS